MLLAVVISCCGCWAVVGKLLLLSTIGTLAREFRSPHWEREGIIWHFYDFFFHFVFYFFQKPTIVDKTSWDSVSRLGTDAEVVAFLTSHSLTKLNLNYILPRLRNNKVNISNLNAF